MSGVSTVSIESSVFGVSAVFTMSVVSTLSAVFGCVLCHLYPFCCVNVFVVPFVSGELIMSSLHN